MTGKNTKAEWSLYWALPSHCITAFYIHALVTKERMASPLDFTPVSFKSSGQPTQETEYLVPEQMRFSHSSLNFPSTTRGMTISTCSK